MIGERRTTTSIKTMARNLVLIPSDGNTWEAKSAIITVILNSEVTGFSPQKTVPLVFLHRPERAQRHNRTDQQNTGGPGQTYSKLLRGLTCHAFSHRIPSLGRVWCSQLRVESPSAFLLGSLNLGPTSLHRQMYWDNRNQKRNGTLECPQP